MPTSMSFGGKSGGSTNQSMSPLPGVRLAPVSLPFALSEHMRGHQAGYGLDANQ